MTHKQQITQIKNHCDMIAHGLRMVIEDLARLEAAMTPTDPNAPPKKSRRNLNNARIAEVISLVTKGAKRKP